MELRPILSAMRRNKVGAILIAVQMAITLAILCNGLFIIEQRISLSHRPTGTDEANIFSITNQWMGEPADLPARAHADLAALRSLPGVVDAYVTNAYPLTNAGRSEGVKLHPDQKGATAPSALYFADEHGLPTLGLKLISGRNFNAAEVADRRLNDLAPPPAVIITRQLADKLFPNGDALGQAIYVQFQKTRAPISGIVAKLQVPWVAASGWGSKFSDNSMIEPFRFVAQYSHYIVRAQPGQMTAVMRAAEKTLIDVNRARVLRKVQSLTDARAEVYRDDRGLSIILGVVCAAPLAVTPFCIVGLPSYSVAQARPPILPPPPPAPPP